VIQKSICNNLIYSAKIEILGLKFCKIKSYNLEVNMDLELRDVTPDNWRKINSLEVKEEQKGFVASNVTILARAFAYRNYNSKVYVVYNENNPIGLIMQRDYLEDNKVICILDQFMIDKNYQGKGFGREAMELWMSMIKNEGKYDSIMLCYIEGNILAERMYESLGFVRCPEEDDEDELVMVYELSHR